MERRNAAVDSGLCTRPDSMMYEVLRADQAQPVRRIVYSSKKRHPFQSKPATYSDQTRHTTLLCPSNRLSLVSSWVTGVRP